jgi:sucrose phosphorylase
VQFFLPGVPQVYYVGLFAGVNDMALLTRTRVGRDINRHYYSETEIQAALQQPVVRDLIGLIRLRNTHPAFDGEFELVDSPDEQLVLRWTRGDDDVLLQVSFATASFRLEYSAAEGRRSHRFSSREALPLTAT